MPREGLSLLDARSARDHPRDEQHSQRVEVGNVPLPVCVEQEVARLHLLPHQLGLPLGCFQPGGPGGCEIAPQHPGGSPSDADKHLPSGGKAREPAPQGLYQGLRQRLHISLPPLRIARLDCAGRRRGIEVEGVCGQASQFARPKAGRCREAVAHRPGRTRGPMLREGPLLGNAEQPMHLLGFHLPADMAAVRLGIE